jgi:hypothetical protein
MIFWTHVTFVQANESGLRTEERLPLDLIRSASTKLLSDVLTEKDKSVIRVFTQFCC